MEAEYMQSDTPVPPVAMTWTNEPPSWRSPEIGELAAALAKAQAVIEDAGKNRESGIKREGREKHRYADLSAVLAEARPVLSANGLAVTQLVSTRATADILLAIVETMLMHKSGQWIRSEMSMPVESRISKDGYKILSGAQEVGVAITYARRYALAAIVGISQEDSDGAPEQLGPAMMTRKQIDDCMDAAHRAFDVQGDDLKAKVRDAAKTLGLPSSAECTYQQGELLLAELRRYAEKKEG